MTSFDVVVAALIKSAVRRLPPTTERFWWCCRRRRAVVVVVVVVAIIMPPAPAKEEELLSCSLPAAASNDAISHATTTKTEKDQTNESLCSCFFTFPMSKSCGRVSTWRTRLLYKKGKQNLLMIDVMADGSINPLLLVAGGAFFSGGRRSSVTADFIDRSNDARRKLFFISNELGRMNEWLRGIITPITILNDSLYSLFCDFQTK